MLLSPIRLFYKYTLVVPNGSKIIGILGKINQADFFLPPGFWASLESLSDYTPSICLQMWPLVPMHASLETSPSHSTLPAPPPTHTHT